VVFIPLSDDNPLRYIRFQWVTMGLIAANVIVFIWQTAGLGETAAASFALIPTELFQVHIFGGSAHGPYDTIPVPEGYTLVTYMFLHGGVIHLSSNMLFLWVFGDNVEDAMGHLKFLAFYLICGVAAGLAHAFMLPNSKPPLIGASGAVAGVIGAYLVLHPRVRVWVLAFRLSRSEYRPRGYWACGLPPNSRWRCSISRTRWPGGRISAAWLWAPFSSWSCVGQACRCSTVGWTLPRVSLRRLACAATTQPGKRTSPATVPGDHLSSCIISRVARLDIHEPLVARPLQPSEIALDQGPRRTPFRPNRSNNGSRPHGPRPANQRPPGTRPPGNPRHASQNARNNYERYTTMAKDAARRGDDIEAENLYQHAEHYFRVMREQES
jgi:membrane associated rhomboid family serine protease